AHLGHIGRHDAIAAFGHHGSVDARPFRAHPDAEEGETEWTRHLAELGEMSVDFARSLMDVLDRGAGELELAARLERDRSSIDHRGEPDEVLVLRDRLPSGEEAHAFEQRPDAARPFVWNRTMAVGREHELFVFGPDAEFRLRLDALLQPGDQSVARLDRRHV